MLQFTVTQKIAEMPGSSNSPLNTQRGQQLCTSVTCFFLSQFSLRVSRLCSTLRVCVFLFFVFFGGERFHSSVLLVGWLVGFCFFCSTYSHSKTAGFSGSCSKKLKCPVRDRALQFENRLELWTSAKWILCKTAYAFSERDSGNLLSFPFLQKV